MTSETSRSETRREVAETQVKPAAGIWYCNRCGRRIQVITDSDYPKVQPFGCVCGSVMEPGEEHRQVDSENQPKPA
jgi:ribosomal protein L37AE/L43A